MKKETRRQKLMELWEDDEEVIEALKNKLTYEGEEKFVRDESSHQAESVVAYVGSQETFYRLHCQGCDKPFASSYARVTTCSNNCLKKVIENIGLIWHPDKSPEDRWRPQYIQTIQRREKESQKDFEGRQENHRRFLQQYFPVPLIVPSAALEILDKMQVFLDDVSESAPLSQDNF